MSDLCALTEKALKTHLRGLLRCLCMHLKLVPRQSRTKTSSLFCCFLSHVVLFSLCVMLVCEWMVGCGLIFSHDMKLLCFICSRFRCNRAAAVCICLYCRCSAASDKEKGKKVEPCTTFPTYCLSVPVYSSNKKNWFHIQPRLERLSGTPLASCPVSPDPLRPPVVLLKALSP